MMRAEISNNTASTVDSERVVDSLQSGTPSQCVGSWRARSSDEICKSAEVYVPTSIDGGYARGREIGFGRLAPRVFNCHGRRERVIVHYEQAETPATRIIAEDSRPQLLPFGLTESLRRADMKPARSNSSPCYCAAALNFALMFAVMVSSNRNSIALLSRSIFCTSVCSTLTR
jgi:hypothetical protein